MKTDEWIEARISFVKREMENLTCIFEHIKHSEQDKENILKKHAQLQETYKHLCYLLALVKGEEDGHTKLD